MEDRRVDDQQVTPQANEEFSIRTFSEKQRPGRYLDKTDDSLVFTL